MTTKILHHRYPIVIVLIIIIINMDRRWDRDGGRAFCEWTYGRAFFAISRWTKVVRDRPHTRTRSKGISRPPFCAGAGSGGTPAAAAARHVRTRDPKRPYTGLPPRTPQVYGVRLTRFTYMFLAVVRSNGRCCTSETLFAHT